MKLLFILYAVGPALFTFSLAYLLRKPEDWTGPAVMMPLMAALTVATQLLGVKKLEREPESQLALMSRFSRYGSLALGVVLFFLAYCSLLAPR